VFRNPQALEIKSGQITTGRWFNTWLENYAKLQVCPSSYKTYRGFIENHIKPTLGNIPLERLTAMELQKGCTSNCWKSAGWNARRPETS